ncbi:MAG: anaerobic sulfatase maturase, partial [Bacillota bacterium]
MFLSLIVKVTRQCNLRCAYCADWRADTPPMSFEVVANLIGRAMRQDRAEEVNFIWHGGEPLLRGTEFYSKVVEGMDV